jgi:hypothetical protein
MNLEKLYEILRETTGQLRKGEVVEQKGIATHIYAMPHESEAKPEIEKVDCCFLVIGVDKQKAEQHREELIEILNTYPDLNRLSQGPSYIEVGGVIGDQGAAFQLFALGKVLGLWQLITPELFGFTGEKALQMAGSGMVMISGYKKEAKV